MSQYRFFRRLLLLTAGIIIGFSFIFGFDQKSQDPFLINKNGKWGYANTSGKIVIKPQFRMGTFFENGYAQVWDNGYRPYLINAKGKKLNIPNAEETAAYFSEGLLAVRVSRKYGYMNESFKWIIKPRFDFARNFSEGLAPVKIYNKFGYIDKTGNFLIGPQFDDAREFSEGLAVVGVYKQKSASISGPLNNEPVFRTTYGYINKAGEMVIEPTYRYAGHFSEGLAVVATGEPFPFLSSRKSGPCGYIDKTGRVAIELKYNDARDFSEGLAAVMVDHKYGYIDKNNELVISPKFSQAYDFKNGLAYVRVGKIAGKTIRSELHLYLQFVTGYINHTGEFASEKLTWQANDAPGKPKEDSGHELWRPPMSNETDPLKPLNRN